MNTIEAVEFAFTEFQKALDDRLAELGRDTITRDEINVILNTIIVSLRRLAA